MKKYPEETVLVYALFEPLLLGDNRSYIAYYKDNKWHNSVGYVIKGNNIGWTPLTSIPLMYV